MNWGTCLTNCNLTFCYDLRSSEMICLLVSGDSDDDREHGMQSLQGSNLWCYLEDDRLEPCPCRVIWILRVEFFIRSFESPVRCWIEVASWSNLLFAGVRDYTVDIRSKQVIVKGDFRCHWQNECFRIETDRGSNAFAAFFKFLIRVACLNRSFTD